MESVLGNIDDLNKSIWIAAVACGILGADPNQVVWLSDGGVGFWRLFREVFTGYATPVAKAMLVKTHWRKSNLGSPPAKNGSRLFS